MLFGCWERGLPGLPLHSLSNAFWSFKLHFILSCQMLLQWHFCRFHFFCTISLTIPHKIADCWGWWIINLLMRGEFLVLCSVGSHLEEKLFCFPEMYWTKGKTRHTFRASLQVWMEQSLASHNLVPKSLPLIKQLMSCWKQEWGRLLVSCS